MSEVPSIPLAEVGGGLVEELLRSGASARMESSRSVDPRLRRLRVRRCMRPPPVAVEPETTLAEAEERMDVQGVPWLPVIENGRLVGFVTRRDISDALAFRPPDLERSGLR